jgi:hypothetical protein
MGSSRRLLRDPPELAALEQVFRDKWGRVFASLVGFLGDSSHRLEQKPGDGGSLVTATRPLRRRKRRP